MMLCIYVNKKETTFLRGDKENLREREKEENDCCHTRSNLGISALLEILQSRKLDHEVAIKCT